MSNTESQKADIAIAKLREYVGLCAPGIPIRKRGKCVPLEPYQAARLLAEIDRLRAIETRYEELREADKPYMETCVT